MLQVTGAPPVLTGRMGLMGLPRMTVAGAYWMAGGRSTTVTDLCPVALSPAALVTVQVIWTEPRVAEVNWICGVFWPVEMTPPTTVHTYFEPGWVGTDAMSEVLTVMTGVRVVMVASGAATTWRMAVAV